MAKLLIVIDLTCRANSTGQSYLLLSNLDTMYYFFRRCLVASLSCQQHETNIRTQSNNLITNPRSYFVQYLLSSIPETF